MRRGGLRRISPSRRSLLRQRPNTRVLSAFLLTRTETFVYTCSVTENAVRAPILTPIFARLRGKGRNRSAYQAKYAASGATKHRRAAQTNSPAYNAAASRAFPSGVSLSTACLPTDSPCRTRPDDWYTLANRRPHCLARTRRGGLRHSSLRNWLNRERAASDAGTAAQKESGPIALRGRKVETPKSSLYAA